VSTARRYATALIVPPLAVALPASIAFVAHVTRMKPALVQSVSVVAAVAYGVGGLVAGLVMARAAAKVTRDLDAGRDPSVSLSNALAETSLSSALLWGGWGLIVCMAGCALLDPTFLGLQYFAEAALLVAAPAMAWAYWLGKHLLLGMAQAAPHFRYTGRMWSIRAKLAIVFIGFFVVSAGALVLVISSRVATRVGEEMAYEIARFGVMMAVITTVIFAIATWFLARDISRPTARLVHVAREMAQGRFSTETRIFSDDEIGHLAESFAVTRTNLRALVGRVGDRGKTIFEGVEAMTGGTNLLVDNVREQSGMAARSTSALGVVQGEAKSVLDEVERVTELTFDSAGRATELRSSFTEVARRMDELFRSVEESSSAATQIDAAARGTADRTTSLAGISSDVLAFVAEMDATTEQVTRTAHATATLSAQVREKALAGRAATGATV
jgi:HAMP domain-containing protein